MSNETAPHQPIDIKVLTQFLNSLQSYSQDLVQHLRSGQKLCHYTSLEGAIGIISGRDLWLTNSCFSNDDEEMNYGYRLVDEILDDLRQVATNDGDGTRVDWLGRLADRIASSRGDQVYVCCFCEKDNLLSQWRGYAENGGGISIEFDPGGFTPFTGVESPHGLMRLWKVFYDREQQHKIVRACIDYPYWAAHGDDEKIPFIADALQFFIPTFKNADFRDEQERRLIFTPYPTAMPKPRFRTRRGLLVPYFSLQELSNPTGVRDPNFRLPIRSILVGPSPHRALNLQSTRLMLDTNECSHVPAQASPTPYRG
ncbi:DUF2971 domain-containing protein [Azotobacter chroococcum subsp. isscasi]|uniref:DUF2971 domain-containing protein n=1 Tax=Azotobacter chroococcum TaxID=353 RepID=UPI00103FEDDE|nr:DUF2971 domain-containing protein [Azotobacter chroococcum]TBW13193.1 DUF2971 domain-containing protein [Azotobacter chroococcum subsp. isscasi]